MAVPRYKPIKTIPLLALGFRPFFLAAGIWACLSMTIWMATLHGVIALPSTFDPITWHFHELLFGFVGAAIAGFLLTAIPNWTGRLPLQGWTLGLLVFVWALGRIAVSFSALIGPLPSAVADLAFLIVFAGFVSREILAGRNWRNLPVLAALILLITGNAMIHAGAIGYAASGGAGERLTISVIVLLIALIGGRIVPSFTTNWLRLQGESVLPVPFNWFDRATLIASAAAFAAWIFAAQHPVTGAALIVAAAAHLVRLIRWRGVATIREPLLWVLHIGYAWLPVGIFLLGLTIWKPGLMSSAVHALTVGGMGTMVVAVMTRASLGHSKRELTAGLGTLTVYLLVLTAAISRLIVPFLSDFTTAVNVAAGAWIAAFALFIVLYFPLYVRR